MNRKSTILGAALAGLLAGASSCQKAGASDDANHSSTAPNPARHSCKGQNACKGQGGCKTDAHACKGQNACKGQGGCAMS